MLSHGTNDRPNHRSGTGLIAERDQNVRELQRFFLEKAGFCVEFADDGQMALDRAQLAKPTVVIAEILLPQIDGLTLCRRLQQDPATRAIPVLIFSVLSAGPRAAEAGAKAYLRKPLVESTFISAVQSVIASNNTASTEER